MLGYSYTQLCSGGENIKESLLHLKHKVCGYKGLLHSPLLFLEMSSA